MKKFLFPILFTIFLLSLAGCANHAPVANDTNVAYNIDYEDAESFEDALNSGIKVKGKTVKFVVIEYKPEALWGINCWAGEHLNFISETELNVKKGDIITGKIIEEPTEIVGSWKVPYEVLNIEHNEFESIEETEDADSIEIVVENYILTIPKEWNKKAGETNDYYYVAENEFLMISEPIYDEIYLKPLTEFFHDAYIEGIASGMEIKALKSERITTQNGVEGYSANIEGVIKNIDCALFNFCFTNKGYLNNIGFLCKRENSDKYSHIFDKIVQSIVLHEVETVSETTKYESGQYKTGIDIPEGEYILFAKSGSGYFCVSSDANGDDIICNDNFKNTSIITIREGQFIELSRCYAIPFEESPNYCLGKKVIGDGMYKIGYHIPAGEYKLLATGSFGYYCLYNDSTHDRIVSNDNFDTSRYINVSNGQYLVLSRCEMSIE